MNISWWKMVLWCVRSGTRCFLPVAVTYVSCKNSWEWNVSHEREVRGHPSHNLLKLWRNFLVYVKLSLTSIRVQIKVNDLQRTGFFKSQTTVYIINYMSEQIQVKSVLKLTRSSWDMLNRDCLQLFKTGWASWSVPFPLIGWPGATEAFTQSQ